jgi:tungstate transport system substrate-binding protein
MGEILQMASEMQAYTLTDRATYLSMKEKLELDIAIQGDGNLFNQYGVIQVNPNKSDKINAVGAERFIQWILSENVQKLIGEFGKDKYGESLFVPNAK